MKGTQLLSGSYYSTASVYWTGTPDILHSIAYYKFPLDVDTGTKLGS